MSSALWPPNGCVWCGALERGHEAAHDYSPPTDALRLARMRARRDARLSPPARPAPPPDTVTTLTANTDDFIDALRYTAASAETVSRAMEALASRMRGAVAELMRETRVLAIGTPGTGTEDTYRTQRCRCPLFPVGEMRHNATAVNWPADEDWPEQGSTCAHVCGPDPGHVCDAKAVTSLRHKLPSGGMRNLPLCAPCAAAEGADGPPANLTPPAEQPGGLTDLRRRLEGEWIDTAPPPPVDRLFVITATRVQFTDWCHGLGISPRDRRIVHVTHWRQLEGASRGLRYLVLGWPRGPGFAAVAIGDGLRSRDAALISDGEFAAWRAALDFAAATHRLLTDQGVSAREVELAAAGILALADNPDAGT